MPCGFLLLDADWTCTGSNEHARRLLGVEAAELQGRRVSDALPDAVGSAFHLQAEAAIREQRSLRFREWYAPTRHWLDTCVCPAPGGGLAVYIDAVDAAKRVEHELDVTVEQLTQELRAEKAMMELALAVARGAQGVELCRLACDIALRVADADAAWVCSVEGDDARILAASTTSPQLLPAAGEVHHVPPGSCMALSLETGELTMAADAGPSRTALEPYGFSSACCLPLAQHRTHWDALFVASTGPSALPVRGTSLGRIRELLQHTVLCDPDPAVVTTAEPEPDRPARTPSALWQRTLDSLTRHVAVIDARGVIVAVNDAWTRYAEANMTDPARIATTGIGADYLRVCEIAATSGGDHAQEVAEELRALLEGRREEFELEYPCHSPTEQRWFNMRATLIEEHGERHVLVQHEDVTARRRAQASAHRQAQLLDEIDTAAICTDLAGTVTLWNDAAERLYGWPREEALGRTMVELTSGPDDAEMIRDMHATLLEHGKWEGEKEICDRSGRSFTCSMRNSVIFDEAGAPVGFLGVSLDTSERRSHEHNLEASRDYLRAITSSIADGLLALNDDGVVIYGNSAATKLLGRSAESLIGMSLAAAVGREAADVVPMLTGDALVRGEEDWFLDADAERLAVTWTASPLKGGPRGEGRVVVFRDIAAEQHDKLRRDKETERLAWTSRIRDAVRDDRFELFAQPILDLRSDELSGTELLLRMHDEHGRLLPPADFLPSAEEHGLMGLIDRWVVRRGAEIADAGQPVHLNLSAQSILEPGVLDDLEQTARRSPETAANLTLELTETELTVDWEAAMRFTQAVRELGFRIALDDFGTGYNSFANLKRISVDEIKIDMQFVRDLLQATASEGVVRAVVSLAGDLGLRTVAEGVEDEQTLTRLRELGVDQAQGFHVGRPARM